ncbi:PucR family transcriptional regulator [Nocardioides sp. NPDC058538]|uniref:PucR family transcriptional regulator n=1 Tax=Nocardioides sp. NPDC058538 TaxID=3346542 RepID=UPI0036629F0C
MTTPAPVERWLQDFAQNSLRPGMVDAFVQRVDDDIVSAIPEIATDPVLVEELHASTREHWRNFLVSLADDYRLALPSAAIAFSLSIARRHLDISVLLKVYRVANKTVFSYVAENTEPDHLPEGLARDEALLALWLRAEQWIDDAVEQLIGHYTRERASLVEGAQARRSEAIEALIAGAAPTPDGERVLGHKLTSWQTAFVLSAPSTSDGGAPLFDLALQICERLGLPRPLTTLAGSRELWGWVATTEEPTVDLGAVIPLLEEAELHFALGRACHGPTAFRDSHLQAVATQRIGRRARTRAHGYADVELVGLVGDGELARAMVRRELAPLMTGARGEGDLRGTALAHLRTGMNVEATAEALYIHPNTVRYRIGRVEDRLGERLAARATMLEVCLTWLEVYDIDVLEGP